MGSLSRVLLPTLPTFFALGASVAMAQSLPGTEGIPQPHLAKARAEAFKGNTTDYPALLACTGSAAAEATIKDPPPTKVFDNLYFVGTGSVAAWAVNTRDGIIVIDSLNNADEAQKYIVDGLKTLSLDPSNIKYVLISHGHIDHFGGAKYLKETYGAHLLASKEDWEFMAKQKEPGVNGATPRFASLVPDHDMDITDGQKFTLGEETITMYVTPGHTPGAVSSIIPVTDHGVPHLLAFLGGFASFAVDAKGHADYEKSIVRWDRIVKDANVEGILANHPAHDDTAWKLYHVRTDKNLPNAFLIGLPAVQRYYNVARECNLNNADVQAARAREKARTN
jgi:metallo-beta-lactamase class B